MKSLVLVEIRKIRCGHITNEVWQTEIVLAIVRGSIDGRGVDDNQHEKYTGLWSISA